MKYFAVFLVVLGAVALAVGISFIYWPAGLATAGALAILFGLFGVEA